MQICLSNDGLKQLWPKQGVLFWSNFNDMWVVLAETDLSPLQSANSKGLAKLGNIIAEAFLWRQMLFLFSFEILKNVHAPLCNGSIL